MSDAPMPPVNSRLPLIAIVGPTASGKTGLAIKLAKKYGGEVICADSRTVYKGMDIGTAKPTLAERDGVSHWGLDLALPGDSFSVADFQAYAYQKIVQIRERGNIPFLVGGSGLYIDAVLYGFTFGPTAETGLRKQLELQGRDELYEYCINNNITPPNDPLNKRHLIRAIEMRDSNPSFKQPLQSDNFVVGITTDKHKLKERIYLRTEHMFENGVVQEAIMLGEKYGWESEAMTGNVYPLLKLYLDNKATLEDVKDKITTTDRRLVKRQMTWFRRNPDIVWTQLHEAESYIKQLLASG